MEISYATRELQRICTEQRYMQRRLGAQRAKKLRLRIDDLNSATVMADLLSMGGRWEELAGDRQGQWSGRLTANWRLIVEPDDEGATAVLVIEMVDYH